VHAESQGICFPKKNNSWHCIGLILTTLFRELREEGKMYSHFMQDNAMVHTANFARDFQE
jgi:hypothetical protein